MSSFLKTAGLVLALSCPPVAMAESTGAATAFLSRAVEAYRAGDPGQAASYLNLAGELRPPGSVLPGFHRLKALLALARGDRDTARLSLEQALEEQPDAFLYYLRGYLDLMDRSYTGAARWYARAALAYDGQAIESEALPALEPLSCGATPEGSAASAHAFSAGSNPGGLWQRGLLEREAALAARVALFFEGGIAEEHRERLTQFADRTADDFPPDLQALMRRGTLDRTALRKCQIVLRNHPEGQQTEVQEMQIRLLQMVEIRTFQDPVAYVRSGAWLLEQSRAHEALYNYRRAFQLSAPTLQGLAEANRQNAHLQVEILRGLAGAYALLGQRSDVTALTTVAAALEDARLSSSGPSVDPASTRQSLFELCGQNLRNRECLVLLQSYLTERNPERARDLERQLARRDEAMRDIELQLLFDY
ncbi:MAG: hypothetical protein KDK35_08435 [Leptospiraceae bacterium]|nr:hypothetical protein [Leptospiraceae bacterium]